MDCRDFPGGPVVKNLPYNAGHVGSIPGQGTKIPHAVRQLSPRATTREKPTCCNERFHVPQLRPSAPTNEPMHSGARAPQLERSPRTTTKDPARGN